MKQKRPRIGKYVFFIMIVGSGLVSYFYSREVYTFLMRSYYEDIKGQSIDELLQQGEKMYQNRDYAKLDTYLRTLILIYPDNAELRQLEGLTLIKLGKQGTGAYNILTTMSDKQLPKKVLEETVLSLFEQKQYRDIIHIFQKNNPGSNSTLLYCYGVSLYKTGDYPRAVEHLKRAQEEGRTDSATHYYLGISYDKKGDTREALLWLERAYEANEKNIDAVKALVNVYRKLGQYDKAEKLLRKMR